MSTRMYHVDSVEYLITSTYCEGKSYLFNSFFGWRKTDENDYAHFKLFSKDWKEIDTKIKYYYVFCEKNKDK